MSSASLRPLLYGFVGGLLFSALRAPLGLDWTQLPGAVPVTAYLFRGAAFLGFALFLDRGRKAFRGPLNVPGFLFAIALGYAFHGFFLATRAEPTSRLGFTVLLVALTLLLGFVAGGLRRATATDAGESDDTSAIPWSERLGWVLAAAGTTIAVENLAACVRRLELGLPEEQTVAGTVFLLGLAVGALAFGAWLRREGAERIFLAVGLVGGASATLIGLAFLSGMTNDGLFPYLQRFGLDYSAVGMWKPAAVLAAASFVVPAFVIGAALSTARHAGRMSSVALGAATGHLLLGPTLERIGGPGSFVPAQPYAWNALACGTVLAFVGACLVLVLRERRLRATSGVLAALVLAAAIFARPGLAVWTFSPWYVVPIEPELVISTAAGLVTVEPARNTGQTVTVDRRRVTPTSAEERVDTLRLSYAFGLLDPEKLAGAGPRVLFIGQLTPARAFVLRSLGAQKLERTAPWYSAVEAVEAVLFDGGEVPGALLSPGEARRRIHRGDYDLVISAPTHGPVLYPKSEAFQPWGSMPAAVFGGLDVPDGTIAVGWLDGAAPLVNRDLGEHVLLAMDRFRHLSIGIVRGDYPREPSPERVALFATGEARARAGAWKLLRTRPRERESPLEAAWMERLGEAARGTEVEEIARALALHFGEQKPSSPYEKLWQQIEFGEETARALFESARAGRVLDPFSREVWESTAWLLTNKRRPDMALAYLEPMAEAHAPWPVLDRALAHAYREMLEPELALGFLERALGETPEDYEALEEAAQLAIELGDPARGVEFLRQATAVRPGDYELRRALAIALARAGDEEARARLQDLLAENPEDVDLMDYLGEGPLPPPETGFEPDSHVHH